MIVIEVNGGVVQDVFGVPVGTEYHVLDWDNLLPDHWAAGDTAKEWNNLTLGMKGYIQGNYSTEYKEIISRMASDGEICSGCQRKIEIEKCLKAAELNKPHCVECWMAN